MFKKTMKQLFFFGLHKQCIVCGSRVRKFLPAGRHIPIYEQLDVVGAGHRPDTLCPVCYSNDRARVTLWYLKQKIFSHATPLRMLHIAPEMCLKTVFDNDSNIEYVMGDINIERYSTSSQVKRIDLNDIDMPSASIDVFVANDVIEHIPDDRRALREVRRIMAPGGSAIMTTPIALGLERTIEDPNITDNRERLARFGQEDHVRIYAQDYEARLRDAGFDVEKYEVAAEGGETLVKSLSVDPRYCIYVCHANNV